VGGVLVWGGGGGVSSQSSPTLAVVGRVPHDLGDECPLPLKCQCKHTADCMCALFQTLSRALPMHTGSECFGSKNATHLLHGYHVRLVVKHMQINEVQRPGTAPQNGGKAGDVRPGTDTDAKRARV